MTLPGPIQRRVDDYLRERGVERPLEVDVALALLNVEGGRPHAEKMLGLRVTQCPAAIPPWPPRPARREARGPSVQSVRQPNPCLPTTDAHRRFALVRVGMTKDKLLAKGVTVRDLRVWQQRGWMTWQDR